MLNLPRKKNGETGTVRESLGGKIHQESINKQTDQPWDEKIPE